MQLLNNSLCEFSCGAGLAPSSPAQTAIQLLPERPLVVGRWAFRVTTPDSLVVPHGTTRSLRGEDNRPTFKRDRKRVSARGTTPSNQ